MKNNLRNIVIGTLFLAGASGCVDKYLGSESKAREVKPGDTIECYARFEGVNEKEINDYVRAMMKVNNYFVEGLNSRGDNIMAIDKDTGKINQRVGKDLWILDYDKNGKVGCKKD